LCTELITFHATRAACACSSCKGKYRRAVLRADCRVSSAWRRLTRRLSRELPWHDIVARAHPTSVRRSFVRRSAERLDPASRGIVSILLPREAPMAREWFLAQQCGA
jgi:hypothetical protein